MRTPCPDCTYVDESWWYCTLAGGMWMHRPWWKVAINTFLRFFQRRGSGDKWVIATVADARDGTYPQVYGYRIRKVWHA